MSRFDRDTCRPVLILVGRVQPGKVNGYSWHHKNGTLHSKKHLPRAGLSRPLFETGFPTQTTGENNSNCAAHLDGTAGLKLSYSVYSSCISSAKLSVGERSFFFMKPRQKYLSSGTRKHEPFLHSGPAGHRKARPCMHDPSIYNGSTPPRDPTREHEGRMIGNLGERRDFQMRFEKKESKKSISSHLPEKRNRQVGNDII